MPTDVRPEHYNEHAHESQTHGHSIGNPESGDKKRPHVPGIMKPLNGAGIFKSSGSVLRNSGHAGAHRLGCKK